MAKHPGWELFEVCRALGQTEQLTEFEPLRYEWHPRDNPPALYEPDEEGVFFGLAPKSDVGKVIKFGEQKPDTPPHPKAKGNQHHGTQGNSG